MKNGVWLALMLSPIASAQEAEVWACQSIEAAGFNWQTEEGYRWESTQLAAADMRLTIAGTNSFYNLDSLDIPLICEEFDGPTPEKFVSCVRGNNLAYDFLVLNVTHGQAALSLLGGAITSNTFYRELVTTTLYQCIKQ